MIPSNACTLRITAAAGTELAGAYSLGTVIILSQEKEFTLRKVSSSTRRCCFRVSPIEQYSLLLPPVGYLFAGTDDDKDNILLPNNELEGKDLKEEVAQSLFVGHDRLSQRCRAPR